MPELGRDTLERSNRGKAASNPLEPELMAARERLAEVASLMAVGFLRYWLHKADKGDNAGLAILRTSSEVCGCPPQAGEPTSEEETRL